MIIGAGKGKSKKKECAQALHQLREALRKGGASVAAPAGKGKRGTRSGLPQEMIGAAAASAAAGAPQNPKKKQKQRKQNEPPGSRSYTCPGCGKGFASDKALESHTKAKKGACKKALEQQKLAEAGRKKREKEDTFRCPGCGTANF